MFANLQQNERLFIAAYRLPEATVTTIQDICDAFDERTGETLTAAIDNDEDQLQIESRMVGYYQVLKDGEQSGYYVVRLDIPGNPVWQVSEYGKDYYRQDRQDDRFSTLSEAVCHVEQLVTDPTVISCY